MTCISNTDIFDELRVDSGLVDDFLHECVEKVIKLGVLETALSSLCEGSSDGEGDDYIVGILGGAGKIWSV